MVPEGTLRERLPRRQPFSSRRWTLFPGLGDPVNLLVPSLCCVIGAESMKSGRVTRHVDAAATSPEGKGAKARDDGGTHER